MRQLRNRDILSSMTNRKSGNRRVCAFEGCEALDNGGGLCSGHYRQRSLGQDLRPIYRTVEGRFWSKVDKKGPDECWEWTGGHNGLGHGKFCVKRGNNVYAHRWSYEQVNGEIPKGLVIDHKCRNAKCVNPKHLHAVTQGVNLQNLATRKGSKSGMRGVYWYASRKKWVSAVTVAGRTYHLGYFEDLEEAIRAVVAKRKELMENSGD